MGISECCHNFHVAVWENKFSNYKKAWPRYLFRHEPIESAIAALKSGVLMSRAEAEQRGAVQKDIAPTDIIGRRDDAHDCVRLYFRPRNPTQFHIEGIRKPVDYYNGKHAGFLVVMMLDSKSILTNPATQFSCGNMQSSTSQILDGDENFNKLDFSGIYHDVAYPSADQIRQRCAEVLPASPLALTPCLQHIVVRTDADVATMKYLLQREGVPHLQPLVKKSSGPGIFFENYTAVDYVDTSPGRINFRLRHTKSTGEIATKIELVNLMTRASKTLFDGELNALTKYFLEHGVPVGNYLLKVQLEGCLAYEAVVELE